MAWPPAPGVSAARAGAASSVGSFGIVVGTIHLVASLPSPALSLPMLLLVGLPAWAFAIFTVAMWYFRRRAAASPPPPATLSDGAEGTDPT